MSAGSIAHSLVSPSGPLVTAMVSLGWITDNFNGAAKRSSSKLGKSFLRLPAKVKPVLNLFLSIDTAKNKRCCSVAIFIRSEIRAARRIGQFRFEGELKHFLLLII